MTVRKRADPVCGCLELHQHWIFLPEGRATLHLGHLAAGLHLVSLGDMHGVSNGKLLKIDQGH
jgi:hypothetical protein